jgi:hypothetical protein
MSRRIFFATALLASAGCQEYELTQQVEPEVVPPPMIEVTPLLLSYGDLAGGQDEMQLFEIINIGEVPLVVETVEITAGISFSLTEEEGALTLDPGARSEVEVVFAPLMGGTNFGQATVTSNDPAQPEVFVDLVGGGLMPELLITPDHHDFGTTHIPCGTTVELVLENVGLDDLVIDAVDYVSAGSLTLDSQLVLPLTLAPTEFATVDVTYGAVEEGMDFGQLLVVSNDPRGDKTADQVGAGEYLDLEASETFDVPVDPPVDILFAVDQSCSMDTEAAALASAFGSFISTIDSVTQGWQVGVVTLEDGCMNYGVLDANTFDYQGKFEDAVTQGGHHNLTEALLELSEKALSKTGPGQCNDGFLRPNAMLHVIVVSDEPEQSGTGWGTWLADMSTYVATQSLLKVSAVIDLGSCGTGNAGYWDAADYTGGEILNICNSNWSNSVGQLATASLSGMNEFALAGTPDGNTVAVFVDGVEWTTGWTWDATTNVVTFDDPQFVGGEVIDVTYAALADCG